MKRLSARQVSIKDPIITEAATPEDIAVRRSRAGLQNEKRSIGSFLFMGSTGVGKTELAKALAEFLFNDENMINRML